MKFLIKLFEKSLTEKILIGLGLVGLSACLAWVHIVVFGKPDYIKSYFLAHLAFLPVHALVLGMAIDGLMSLREKVERRKKLSMLVGIFFRQVGLDLFAMMSYLVKNREDFDNTVMVQPEWNSRRFARARSELETTMFWIKADKAQLAELFRVLMEKEEIIIRMTTSPHLLEFENLHKALLRLFHLIEEFHFRSNLEALPPGAIDHLAHDVSRALSALSVLWLEYLEHLKRHHPVLFQSQTGIHNVINPVMFETDWEQS